MPLMYEIHGICKKIVWFPAVADGSGWVSDSKNSANSKPNSKNFGFDTEAQVGGRFVKKQRTKVSCYYPFKDISVSDF